MIKFRLLLGFLVLFINGFSQTLTFNDVQSNPKGTFTEYISSSGQSFKVNDTLTLGVPFRNENFDFVVQNAGIAYYPLPGILSGGKVIITKIKIEGKRLKVNTTTPPGNIYSLSITNFEEAIKQGEIKSKHLSSDEALKKLKSEKEKLDLGLITQEEYNTKKAELIKYIK